MWVHRLSNIEPVNRLANCQCCGVVHIARKANGYRCGAASYANNVRRKYGVRIQHKVKYCQVCGSDRRIVYDHSHQTGQFRGWLCNACNVALGLVQDNPARLRKLADYIEASKKIDVPDVYFSQN